MNLNVPTWVKNVATWIGILGGIGGATWAIAQPIAEKVVNDIVQKKVGDLSRQVEIFADKLRQNEIDNAVIKDNVGDVKEELKEQRTDIKTLLRELRGVAREVTNPNN